MHSPFTKQLLFSCLFLAGQFSLHAAEIVSFSDGLLKAKEEKKSLIVVSDGSDWLPVSPQLNKVFKETANKFPDSEGKFIWAIYDAKNTNANDEASQKAPKPPMKVWNYPAVQVLDSEGRPLYFKEGINPDELKTLPAILPKIDSVRIKRDEYLDKAAKEKGDAAIENIAKGLNLLDEKIIHQDSYKALIERIKQEDPADKKGYYLHFTFMPQAYMENEINKRLDNKQFKEAYEFADEKLKLPCLTPYQKQALLTGKFHIALVEGNLPVSLQYLKQVVSIDPSSDLAKGATYMAAYYTQPIKLDGMHWTKSNNRPIWLPMIVDVSQSIKGPGRYQIEFKHTGGNTRFRNPSFKTSGGRTLASLTDGKESRQFSLEIPSGGKVFLEVESMGTGWFDGRGDIIITKI